MGSVTCPGGRGQWPSWNLSLRVTDYNSMCLNQDSTLPYVHTEGDLLRDLGWQDRCVPESHLHCPDHQESAHWVGTTFPLFVALDLYGQTAFQFTLLPENYRSLAAASKTPASGAS